MTQAISHIAYYHAFWQSLATRRRSVRQRKGLDLSTGRWFMRARQIRCSVRRWSRLARRIDAMEPAIALLSEPDLSERLSVRREVFCRRRATDSDLLDALALLREVARREIEQKPYVVQLIGALGIYHGQIVEMVTGEGKTLAAVLAATLLAWSKPSVHIVTANGYLARRDVKRMAPIYERAGVSVGCVVAEGRTGRGVSGAMRTRMAQYRRAVVYTTQKEVVADWLRDQLRLGLTPDAVGERLGSPPPNISGRRGSHVLVPGLHAAIIDEADAVLIDHAITPLVITTAGGRNRHPQMYQRATILAGQLKSMRDYTIEPVLRRVRLTREGKERLTQVLDASDRGTWRVPRRRYELVEQALSASHFYRRDREYALVDGRVTMIDEFSGRFMPDRKWQHGIHQAIEAKEELSITGMSRTRASLSFQRFFRLYPFLAGMTGTARGARREFEQTYQVPVRIVPPNRPVRRTRERARISVTAEQKWDAVVRSVAKLHERSRPVLVATRSVEASQRISAMLQTRDLSHHVLNAVHHEQEAQIIAQAGQRGVITVATNMAGRGTDIILGPGVAELGGLHVILTEHHEASRIDQQMIGRSGRQGDPGSSQVFPSLEDELLATHGPSLIKWVNSTIGCRFRPMGSCLGAVALMIAQRRSERRAFVIRKAVLRREDWLDQAVPSS